MLPPEYMAGIADASEELASKLHSDIMRLIIERMMARAGRGEDYMLTATDKWNIESMQQAGYLYQDILLELSKFTGQSEEIVRQAMLDAGVQALDNDQKIYEKAGIPELDKLSDRYRAMIEADYTACNGSIYNLTRTTADAAQRTFINECDSIYFAVTRGYDSYTNAIAKAVERISEADGIYVTYPSGKRTSVEAAVSRCVRTGVAQMAGHISEQRAKDVGCEHFLVSSHLGARPSHAEWQGKVFKIHGSDKKYQNFKETTGYGTGAGLCGWNCRHSFSPFFPEFMENNQEQYDVKENEEEYNRRQEEKRKERALREKKRKADAYKTASECAGVPEDVKKVLEERHTHYPRNNNVSEKGISGKRKQKTNENSVDIDYINSTEYRDKFRTITDNHDVNKELYKCARAELTHRNGTYKEDMYLISSIDGKTKGFNTSSKKDNIVSYNSSLKNAIASNPAGVLISIHNHGTNLPPTGSDFASAGNKHYKQGVVVCHNGDVYVYGVGKMVFSPRIFDDTVAKYKNMRYTDIEAHIKALEQFEGDYGIWWRKL